MLTGAKTPERGQDPSHTHTYTHGTSQPTTARKKRKGWRENRQGPLLRNNQDGPLGGGVMYQSPKDGKEWASKGLGASLQAGDT